MSYDAKKAAYQEVTILGRPALFAECRICLLYTSPSPRD